MEQVHLQQVEFPHGRQDQTSPLGLRTMEPLTIAHRQDVRHTSNFKRLKAQPACHEQIPHEFRGSLHLLLGLLPVKKPLHLRNLNSMVYLIRSVHPTEAQASQCHQHQVIESLIPSSHSSHTRGQIVISPRVSASVLPTLLLAVKGHTSPAMVFKDLQTAREEALQRGMIRTQHLETPHRLGLPPHLLTDNIIPQVLRREHPSNECLSRHPRRRLRLPMNLGDSRSVHLGHDGNPYENQTKDSGDQF